MEDPLSRLLRKQTWPPQGDKLSNLDRGLTIDSTYKNCLWWPCLLTDQDEMSNFYRGPSIDAAHQVSVHLDK
jgi:hypothetical protein